MTRVDGFASLGGYGLVGDGRSVALVAADGAVDWWAAPALDAPPLLAALLDPETGGRFTLEPAVPYQVQRRYLPDTNVLETTFLTSAGQVQVIDALNLGGPGPLPWTELVREVSPLTGEVPMRWRMAPGTRFGRTRAWARLHGGTPLLQVGDQLAALIVEEAGEPQVGLNDVHGVFTAVAGTEPLLAVALTDGEPVSVPEPAQVRRRLRATEQAWRRWSSGVRYSGADREVVLRSALILKMLTYAPTGGLCAAATTSLPEVIGGERNFDYRYGWIRDTSFALEALVGLGLTEEAHAMVSWMLDAVAGTAPDIRPFYGMRGSVPTGQSTLPLRGYRDSRPVHDGNGAVDQPQWGNYGDLFQSVWLGVDSEAMVLDPATARTLEAVADRVCQVWPQPDAGIWELGTLRHYTISKIACWSALDRAVELAECGQLAPRAVERWKGEREAVRAWVDRHCWSQRKRSYTFYAGTDELDASVLLAARTGFVAGDDPRFGQTIDAVSAELTDGPLVYRYSGSRKQENAFVACSFWLVDALTRAGRAEQARRIWDGMAARTGELGLLGEQFDPAGDQSRGNLPQALSHLALIVAACRLGHTTSPDQRETTDKENADGV